MGSVGDSYDNALAESIIGVFKTEVINFLGPRQSVSQVESHYTTQGWLRAAEWIQLDDSEQENVQCHTKPLPPSWKFCAPKSI